MQQEKETETPSYTFASDAAFQQGVRLWFSDRETCVRWHGPISDWRVGNVRSMRLAFADRTDFDEDLSRWDTGRVEDMSGMFCHARAFRGDLSGWDTRQVRTMDFMFCNARSFDCDLSGWDTSQVVSMNYMFCGASRFHGDSIRGWDTRKVEGMRCMFYNAPYVGADAVYGWRMDRVSDAIDMFHGAGTRLPPVLCPWRPPLPQHLLRTPQGQARHPLQEQTREQEPTKATPKTQEPPPSDTSYWTWIPFVEDALASEKRT